MWSRVPSRRGLGLPVLLGFALVWVGPVLATFGQVSPEESARQLKPAEGLEATLWAAEPMVVNPTNMDIDSRGRVWITEGLNYRLSRGGNKKFQRIEAADRIKILEDTDGDGKADKMTVFADRIFPVPMGIAVEERYGKDGRYLGCKVYVGNSPNLLVLEDTDGDDQADKRYPLLTGFGGIDSDHGVHGMVLGLDGKLYFTHGDGCCSVQQDKSERPENFNVIDNSGRHVSSTNLANTLRSNRDGTQFEILADRQRNNYETSLNSFGNIFTSDNDDDGNRGSRVIWVMDGGHYGYRTPGSPRHWGEDVPGNVPKLVGTGNGSPCGIMVYEGSLLPKEYFGCLFEADAGTRQINFFPITRQGAAFRTEYKVLLASNDPWFRPVDMTAAQDGSVFVADWYDAGVGGHAFSDQTTGRIYRVAPKGHRSQPAKPNFATIPGLIAALKSPVVATQDVARRLLIERGQEGVSALSELFAHGEPIHRARALWVLHAIQSDAAVEPALGDSDPRIREQAVRILGRDVSRNGKVEYTKPGIETPLAASAHLNQLLPKAHDPDAGVRRELILALRDLPTGQVGEALRTLARSWDGQDRWYLEALGEALEKRESGYIQGLLGDGQLYANLGLPESGRATGLALPPYFPVDRNEAFIATGETERPASALSKTIGLAWRLHRVELLRWLRTVLPQLASAELQEAADDALMQVSDPSAAAVVAELALESRDPLRKRELLDALGRKLDGSWHAGRTQPSVVQVIEAALNDAGTQLQGIAMAAASGEPRYAAALQTLARNSKTQVEARVAAVEAVGRIQPPQALEFLSSLIQDARTQKDTLPIAEAAVRVLPRFAAARTKPAEILADAAYPLALRREALRTFAQGEGGFTLIGLAKENKIPAELKTEAMTVLYTHPDRRVRQQAAEVLPPPKLAGGRTLPPVFELIRREGNPNRGREVFFRTATNACGSCHRVQGRGQWVGPDLSTIGTKYGKDELLRSILNPSAAIGYNFQAYTVAMRDGRVLVGLPVEQAPDRLVLKLADGQRVSLPTAQIEDKKQSDVSLMPEGLAATMSDQELVDLLAYLTTLRQPVSIVGQYHVAGPISQQQAAEAAGRQTRIDVSVPLSVDGGRSLPWRRLNANTESLLDLSGLAGQGTDQAILLYTPVNSPADQDVQLVIDTRVDATLWLNGKPVALPDGKESTRTVGVRLNRGSNGLLICVPARADASLVTTLIAPQPLEFSTSESAKVSAR